MSDLNAEFPSTFELWEFVLSFEDGSMPPSAWNERTLAVIAIWYLFLLPPGEAMERLELGLRRNQSRFSRRPGCDRERRRQRDGQRSGLTEAVAASGR